MTLPSQEFEIGRVPELSLSLWSLRHRMHQDAASTLGMLKEWGVSTVEVAGFFTFRASDLKRELTKHKMRVSGVVGPPIDVNRDMKFFTTWMDAYLSIFQAPTLVLQSLSRVFAGSFATPQENWRRVGDLLVAVSTQLAARGIRVSYHCFPHDFEVIEGESLVTTLFARNDLPDNLGLQLDTYWLRVGSTAPEAYARLPVHSVHLNERDSSGNNRELGEDRATCAYYVESLVHRDPPIQWILENDSSLRVDEYNEGRELRCMEQCVTGWPRFYQSLRIPRPSRIVPCATTAGARPIYFSQPAGVPAHLADDDAFRDELDTVLTEHLFGTDHLETIASGHPALSCYVEERIDSTNKATPRFAAERAFFSLFWPSERSGEQLIQLVGGAGTGKSTFVRYFFQYLLPQYEHLVNGHALDSPLQKMHQEQFERHILLYVDLRRAPQADQFRPWLFQRLSEGLEHVAMRLRMRLRKGGLGTEEWLKRNLARIAQEALQGERRWFVSWILDNADQMDECDQVDLTRTLLRLIPEEVPRDPAKIRVQGSAGSGRDLWRIVLPVRPETLAGLAPRIAPSRNVVAFHLDPINQDELVKRRAECLADVIRKSEKGPYIDVEDIGQTDSKLSDRPQFDMLVPSEKAEDMRQSLLVAHAATSEDPGDKLRLIGARELFDLLVSGSARRRLCLVRRIACSPVFRERVGQGRLSKFYYLEALIRGNSTAFSTDHNNHPVVVNLYDLGAASEPVSKNRRDWHSVFVGLHAMLLIVQRGMDWKTARELLAKLGYSEPHLEQCEMHLRAAEVVRTSAGYQVTERDIARGHWALLCERAYTDNMAVACARRWGDSRSAVPTDPLSPQTLLTRFSGSLWFMEEIWRGERELARYPADYMSRSRCGTFQEFVNNWGLLYCPKVSSITSVVAEEYLRRISTLPSWVRPKSAIQEDQGTWDRNLARLQSLISDASKPEMLSPKNSE